MLTKEHAVARIDRGRLFPDRLTRGQHAHYARYVQRLLKVYAEGAGIARRELHRRVREVFVREADCPLKRIEAFCKLLDDAATYHEDRRGKSAELRQRVFRQAAALHPLVGTPDSLFEHEEHSAKAEIARKLGRAWDEIDRELFADVIEFHRLRAFEGYPSAQALLARYNVAQVQAALYRARELTIWATDDFKTILRYAKLARLMHTIRAAAPGRYEIRFDGPASVLRETRRYGAAMARFLPALIACRGWRLHAVIQTSRAGWNLALDLSSQDGLTSHLPPPEAFDSQVEAVFAEKWGPEPREGWTLVREGQVLHHGQKVFVPDFVFRHHDGRTALLEIVGFWTPEYLAEKWKTLRMFADQRILLAVMRQPGRACPRPGPETQPGRACPRPGPETQPGRACPRTGTETQPVQESSALPPGAIVFKTALLVKDVLQRLILK